MLLYVAFPNSFPGLIEFMKAKFKNNSQKFRLALATFAHLFY